MKELNEIRKEIENLTYYSEGMGCGLEDREITDRYEACEYGWNEAIESVIEVFNNIENHDDTDVFIKCNNCSRRKLYMLGYEDAVKEEPGVTKEFLKQCKQVVKKYEKNYSGWISLEERMPEKNEYFVETSSDKDFPNGYYKRLEIAYMTDTIEYVHGYYDGYKWMDKYLDTIKNVVAWRIHEPYCPERSDSHDEE